MGGISASSSIRCASENKRDDVQEQEWTSSVTCVRIDLVGCYDPDATEIMVNDKTEYVRRIPMNAEELLKPIADAKIESLTEWRQPWSIFQQWNPIILYHAFAVLDMEGDYTVCTEKYNDKLELMVGKGEVMRAYVQQYRPTGEERLHTCRKQRTSLVNVPVRHLLEWINGPLAIVWQPYDVYTANCQHYVRDLYQILQDPSCVDKLKGQADIVFAAVQRDGMRLQFAADHLRDDAHIVAAAVEQNVEALQFASDRLRCNETFVSATMSRRLQALQFAAEELKGNREFVKDAMSCRVQALEFASEALRNDRDFVLDRVTQNSLALQFAGEGLLKDRAFVFDAVSRNVSALQFAPDAYKNDRDFLLDVVALHARALQFASEDLRSSPRFVLAAIKKNDSCRLMADSKVLPLCDSKYEHVFRSINAHAMADGKPKRVRG